MMYSLSMTCKKSESKRLFGGTKALKENRISEEGCRCSDFFIVNLEKQSSLFFIKKRDSGTVVFL